MPAAFPFIEVGSIPRACPVAERAPGVIAVVGESATGAAAVGAVVTVELGCRRNRGSVPTPGSGSR